jgi:hypothetical protein
VRLWAVNPAIPRPVAGGGSLDPVTGRLCAQHESARNAGETPGCGTADGAARRTPGTPTGAPPVPAGRECRRPACGARAEREAAAARAAPVPTRNAGTQVRTHRTGSLAPRPAPCHAAAAQAAACSMRSYVHGKAAVSPAGNKRGPEGTAQNIQSGTWNRWSWRGQGGSFTGVHTVALGRRQGGRPSCRRCAHGAGRGPQGYGLGGVGCPQALLPWMALLGAQRVRWTEPRGRPALPERHRVGDENHCGHHDQHRPGWRDGCIGDTQAAGAPFGRRYRSRPKCPVGSRTARTHQTLWELSGRRMVNLLSGLRAPHVQPWHEGRSQENAVAAETAGFPAAGPATATRCPIRLHWPRGPVARPGRLGREPKGAGWS